MTATSEMKGKDAEIVIRDVPVGLTDIKISMKTGEVSQDIIGSKYPRKSPGTSDVSIDLTNVDLSGELIAMALATDAVASTRLVLSSCDASTNWASNDASSNVSVDTSVYKEGTGCVLVTNTGDCSGNTVTLTLGAQDLSGYHLIECWLRASNTGEDVVATFGFGEAAITENTKAINIRKANTFQLMTYDISEIADSAKNACTKFGLTLGADSSSNTIRIDELVALKGITLGAPEYFDIRANITDPNDSTKFQKVYLKDCYFLNFDMSIPGGASKVIEGPMSVGIKDASKLKYFFS